MERNPELIADPQDVIIPTVNVVFPYDKLTTSFEKAINRYMVLDEEALLKAAKASGDENEFIDVAFEELFNIPVTDGNAYNAKVSQYMKEGRVESSGSQLSIVSIDREYERIEAPRIILSVPPTYTIDTATTTTTVQSAPTVTPYPQHGLPTAPDVDHSSVLESLLNIQPEIVIGGNVFSKGASFGPSGGIQFNAFFTIPIRSGASEDRSSQSVVTLTTADGNTLNFYLTTSGGHQIGDYRYEISHAVPHYVNKAQFDVDQVGQNKIFNEQFVYSLTNAFHETNIGMLSFHIVDDVPLATNQNPGSITEADIQNQGTSQSNAMATLLGSLIDLPINRFGADGGTVSNVTVSGGGTVIASNMITVTTAQGNTLSVDQLTGDYTFTLTNPLQHKNNQPINQVFNYEFTDGDGSVAAATLTISVNDDIPIANVKTNTADETAFFVNGSETASGNLMSDDNGFGISLFGADGGVISAVNGTTDASDGLVDGIIHATTTYGDMIVYALTKGAHQVGEYEYTLDGSKTVLANDNLGTVNDTINYVLTDGDGSQDNANVTISIALNRAPTAVDDTGQTDEDAVLTVLAINGVLMNDTDPNVGDTQIVSKLNGSVVNVGVQITLASNALVQLNANGSYSYDPNGAFDYLAQGSSTTDSFTYTMRDAEGLSDTATVTLTINGVNSAPVAVDDSNTTHANLVINVNTVNDPNNLLINDTDVDVGDTLAISKVQGLAANVGDQIALASGALLTVNADGTYIYDPNGAFATTNTDSFTYEISDNHGSSSNAATVTIDVIVPPIVLDLNDDGISLISRAKSQVSFLLFDREQPTTIGWVSGQDGLLAIDLNGDNIINGPEEFTFTHPQAKTDLEALRILYDSNVDGILDMNDADWLRFGVWQDANENGICEPGEF